MLQIKDLNVSQIGLRCLEQINKMIDFVSKGGLFTVEEIKKYYAQSNISKKPALIAVSLFEDGRMFVHDGHHRFVSILMAGRDYLDDGEYFIKKFKYEDYIECNENAFKNGWFTPFDPRTEIRLAEFLEFKKQAINIFQHYGPKQTENYVKNHKHLYCKERLI